MKSKTIREKRDSTMIEKYGHSYSFDNEEIEKKRKETINNRTKEEKDEIVNKWKSSMDFDESVSNFKKTMKNKYGVEHALQCEKIKSKMREKIKK